MTQASFTQVAVLRSLSTHDALGTGMRTGLPGGEDRPSEGWQAVEWTEVRRAEALGPTRGLGRALQVKLGLEATRSPRAHLPRGSGVPAARPAIRARQQSGNGRGASPGGDAAWQRGGGSAASVPPAFVLAAARGARPGAMKGPSVCAPAAPLGFHS